MEESPSDESGEGSSASREVSCPLCEDFVGSVRSVAGHISGSKGVHKGEVGSNYTAQLKERASPSSGTGEQIQDGGDQESPEVPSPDMSGDPLAEGFSAAAAFLMGMFVVSLIFRSAE
jgi:hypothetical protein